ncbi:MAG: FKBP-type peptidyl-prolyl cis-trans isomerase [Bacteroidales bacterium]
MKLLIRLSIFTVGMAILFTGCQTKSIDVDVKSEADSLSYALGVNIAASMEQNDFEDINILALAKGLQDANSEKEGVMSNDEAIAYIREYMTKENERKANEAMEEGESFLEENAKKEDVIVDSTGLQYKVLVEGDGPKPKATDKVSVHYHGTLVDGTVFDSSVERGEPLEISLNGVIKGWTIGLQKMNVGSKYKLYIPSDLAYGANPRPGGAIRPNETLIFEVELLEILEEEK